MRLQPPRVRAASWGGRTLGLKSGKGISGKRAGRSKGPQAGAGSSRGRKSKATGRNAVKGGGALKEMR